MCVCVSHRYVSYGRVTIEAQYDHMPANNNDCMSKQESVCVCVSGMIQMDGY